jgi:hypothetical protein
VIKEWDYKYFSCAEQNNTILTAPMEGRAGGHSRMKGHQPDCLVLFSSSSCRMWFL